MDCLNSIFSFCLVSASGLGDAVFFGFAEFIGAFALLAIVFMIADVQYRFRIQVCPLPLHKITFWAIGIIGFGTLATDLWVEQGWLVFYFPHMTYGVIQGLFAMGFLMIAMAWLYFAFLRPPVFSKWNAQRYGQAVFDFLLRGSDSELPIIAMELRRSADELIEAYDEHRVKFQGQLQQHKRGENVKLNPGNYAQDVLHMIGNRKFCRHVVASSPATAISLFQAAAKRRVYDAPIGQFSKNISAEAIRNPDSNLYHEDSAYKSGLFGHLKPFTEAIYGTYRIVEGLQENYHSSPLSVDFELTRTWTAPHLKVYARAVLTTFADRLKEGYWHEHSYSLYQAMQKFDESCWDVYKLDGVENGDPDIRERLRVCVWFVTELIGLLEKYEDSVNLTQLNPGETGNLHDIHDQIAELMSNIIYNVSAVKKPVWECWDLQHNTVWSEFFSRHHNSRSRRIIVFRLRRLIYEEIIDFDRYTDFKSFKAARYLGICLNCLGVRSIQSGPRHPGTAPLRKVILNWVQKNYHTLHMNHRAVANACLMGGISYDADNNRLVKSYIAYSDREPDQEFLELSLTGPKTSRSFVARKLLRINLNLRRYFLKSE